MTARLAAFAACALAATTVAAVAGPCDVARNGLTVLSYDTGVSQLSAEQKAKLDAFAEVAQHRNAVCVLAQVDKQGSAEANRKVATARGETVRAYLEAHGVRPAAMEVIVQSEAMTLFGLIGDDSAADRRVTVSYK
jgi:outer membrane protein OmpA-like peptidoglycan-associated protein